MAFRLYIVPVVGSGSSQDPRRPKYFMSDASGQGRTGIITDGTPFRAQDYGHEAWMVVGGDLTTSDDNLVVGQADAFALPFDLATFPSGAQVTNVKNKLEAINVPAGWVNTSIQWLTIVRVVLGMFTFMQRYAVLAEGGTLFGGGVTLATTFGALPDAKQTALVATADSFALDRSGLTNATTMRAILKALADQFGDRVYDFAGTRI